MAVMLCAHAQSSRNLDMLFIDLLEPMHWTLGLSVCSSCAPHGNSLMHSGLAADT